MKEQVSWWRVPDPGEPELLKASFRTRTFARHAHERFAIGVIEAGGLAFRYRGEEVLAPAGWVNLAFPGEAHCGRPAGPEGWTYRMFYLDPSLVDSAANALFRTGGMPFIPMGAVWDPLLARRIASLHRYCEDPGSEPLERQVRLGLILQDVMLRYGVSREDRPADRARSEVEAARRYLDAHCGERVLLQDLASRVGMNPYRLVRSFTRDLGMPPHAYLVQARVHRAANLLRRGIPPAQAALDAGFADQSHLNRHFLRCFGIPPGSFRKAFRS